MRILSSGGVGSERIRLLYQSGGTHMARILGGYGLGRILILVAVVIFVLAAFGVDIGEEDITLVPLGLAFFAAGHLV
jgi:hypothetical protein